MNLRWLFFFVFGFLLANGSSLAGERAICGLLGEGKPWETPYHIRDTGIEGPSVLVIGGMHGNEPAGAAAAEQIRHWPLARGKLITIPRANIRGLEEGSRYIPGAPEERRDLNRNFPGDSLEGGTRGEIAAAIWKLTLETKPDWIFDLHEGYEFNISHQPKRGKPKSVGSSLIYFSTPEMDDLAKQMQTAANATVTDPDRKFTLLNGGTKERGLINAAVRHLGVKGMILETTFKQQRLPIRTRQHRLMMNVALRHVGLIDQDCADFIAPAKSDEHIRVALFDGNGSSENGISNTSKALAAADDISVVRVGPADIRPEILSQFDAVIFSGGSGSKQAASISEGGSAAVRQFVEQGGGYLGICAGAFLCSSHYPWSLDLVDTHVLTGAVEVEGQGKKQMWYRGKWAPIKIELTDHGRRVFKGIPEMSVVRYHNGPIVSRKQTPELEDYRVLAWYRSETFRIPQQKGTMINTPAIVEGGFGEGRVMSISPHPEATQGLEPMIVHAVRTVVQRAERVPVEDADPENAVPLSPNAAPRAALPRR